MYQALRLETERAQILYQMRPFSRAGVRLPSSRKSAAFIEKDKKGTAFEHTNTSRSLLGDLWELHEMRIANTIIIIVFPYSKGRIKNEPLSIEKI